METVQTSDVGQILAKAQQLHRTSSISVAKTDFTSLVTIASNCLAAGLSAEEVCELLIEEMGQDP